MVTPTAYSLAKMFSQLTSVQVNVSTKPRPTPSKSKAVYGVYHELPEESVILLRAELPLMASLAGGLVGFPESALKERLSASGPMDEVLRDAVHELLNITSTPLSTTNRVVFKSMCMEAEHLNARSRSLLDAPIVATSFDITVKGYTGGELSIFASI